MNSPQSSDPGSDAPPNGPGGAAQAGFRPPHAEGAASDMRREAAAMAEDLKAQGQDLAEAAKDRARTFSEEQKALGADQMSGVARAVGKAADELEQSSPGLARYTREAASAVDTMSDALRNRSVGDLVHSANDFARREPVAFFGAAIVAGFALSRFLKSTREDESTRQPAAYRAGSASPAAPVAAGDVSSQGPGQPGGLSASALGTGPVTPGDMPKPSGQL